MPLTHGLPKFAPHFIAEALHLPPPIGNLYSSFEPFSQIATDTRAMKPGCLFVALKGDNFDGHAFIDDAINKGARGILCQRGTPLGPHKGVFPYFVEDTLASYRKLASKWRAFYEIPMIAVAGSVGKTTTKEILAAALQGKWKKVLKTHGSQNGFIGIPMTLLELNSEHEAAVVEVGIDEIGVMVQHMDLVKATASLLTAIGAEHLEKLRDIPTVAQEEGFAFSAVTKTGGVIAVNLDDPWIRPHFATTHGGTRVGYTLTGVSVPKRFPSDVIVSGTLSSDGTQIQVSGMGSKNENFDLVLPGFHNAKNLLAAIAMACGLGVTADEIRQGLKTFKGAAGRSELKELPGPTLVVCDYYNASPESMNAGFDLLTEVASRNPPPRKRWACLGDMLELGLEEENFHRALSLKLIALGIENVLLYGERMKALQDELKSKNFAGAVEHFSTHQELTDCLTQSVSLGDVILIKGSHGMKMEEIYKPLEAYALSHWKK